MFDVAVGHSEDPDVHGAAKEIREQCEKHLSGEKPKAGILFVAIDFDREGLLAKINTFWPGLELIGCSTDGEVSSQLGFKEDSVVLVLFASDTIDITAGIGRHVGENTALACRDAVEMARSKTTKESAMSITIPESLTCSGQQIVDCLVSELGVSVPLIGGTSGDQFRMKKTYQFFGNEVLSDAVPLLLFSGPLDCSFATGTGFKPMGPQGIVTRSEGPLLYEIDSTPAAEFYRKMMGSETMNSTETPLAVVDAKGEIEYLRAVAGDFDPQIGSISLFADIPEGSRVQIATMNRDSLVDSCVQAIHLAGERFHSQKCPPAAALIFSCSGRKVLLGTRTAEEQHSFSDTIGALVPCAGFYTYGEICPSIPLDAGARFHNHTFVIALLGERNA